MCSTHSSCSSAQFVEKKTEWKTDAFLTFIFSTQAWVSFNPFYGKSKIMKEVGVGKWWCGARLVILNLVPTGHQQKDCTRHGTNTNSTDPGAVMPSNGFRLQLEPFSMRGLFMQMFFFNVKHPKKDHCHLMDQFLTHIYVSPETSLQLSPSCSALWASLTCFQLGCASPRTSKLPKNTFCVTLTQHVHVVNHHRFRAHVICWKEQTGDVRDSHHRLLLLHPILTAPLYRSASPWLWLLQLLIQFKIKGHHFGTS